MENIRSTLVGTSNFKVINVIKKGQNYYNAQFSPKNFFSASWVRQIPTVPICSTGPEAQQKKQAKKKNQATLVGVKVCQRFLYNRENEVPTTPMRF